MKLIIIANRLPVKICKAADNTLSFVRSEGGLTTGLDSLKVDYPKHWIGWPGVCLDDAGACAGVRSRLEEQAMHPVFLSEKDIEQHYEGYSNSTLWPMCHYFYTHMHYEASFWEAYRHVNQLFCEEAAKLIEPGDIVWVQDYQLMLLPGMLRELFPDISIGYFHHIPFPSYELFRILPERADLLNGLLGADLIGFHTHDYMRHFVSAVERVLSFPFRLDEVAVGTRRVKVDAFPMGINYALYHDGVNRPEVQERIRLLEEEREKHKLILSVDRLDYSKGILHRVKGFAEFLKQNPAYRGKVTLNMIIVPSRDKVEQYADLKVKIDEAIGAINGAYSTVNWTPVRYFYHAFPLEELIALYHEADIALVTPLRDGMNLVCKEFVAAKADNPGVLVLSEMAGAAVELTDALIINPNDVTQIAVAVRQALEMPRKEQMARLKRMQRIVAEQTVERWAADFVGELKRESQKNELVRKEQIQREKNELKAGLLQRVESGITTAWNRLWKGRPVLRVLDDASIRQLATAFQAAGMRLVILDYDGTLAPFCDRPEEAVPSDELLDVLRRMGEIPRTKVVINSGRDYATLDRWFGQLPVLLAAEHGAMYKERGKWYKTVMKDSCGEGVLQILQYFTRKTPGSRIERKVTSVAWHYRQVDSWLADLRRRQIVDILRPMCQRRQLQLMEGNKVIEIKSTDVSKGMEVARLMEKYPSDFVLAMGDDTTDEDMFRALPASAYTIKLGEASGTARFRLTTQSGVMPLLKQLVENVNV